MLVLNKTKTEIWCCNVLSFKFKFECMYSIKMIDQRKFIMDRKLVVKWQGEELEMSAHFRFDAPAIRS